MFEYLIDRGVPDAVDQLERTEPRQCVRRFDHHTQERQSILDVRRLGKADTAELPKWNVVLAQLDFEVKGMRARTKQNRNFAKRNALFAQLFYPFGDKTG